MKHKLLSLLRHKLLMAIQVMQLCSFLFPEYTGSQKTVLQDPPSGKPPQPEASKQPQNNNNEPSKEDPPAEGFLEALGPKPNQNYKVELPLVPDIVERWSYWVKHGLERDRLEFFIEQYNFPKFLKVPELNPEVLTYLQQNARDRDAYLVEEQHLIAASLASLLANFIVLVDKDIAIDKEFRSDFTEMLAESAQLIAHQFFEKTLSRRACIIRAIKSEEVKRLLKDQETDEYLFGSNLLQRLKSLKMLEKAAAQIGATPQQPKSRGSAGNFLAQRALHPFRNNARWPGQGSQQNRWSFNQYQNPQSQSSSQRQQQPYKSNSNRARTRQNRKF